jgi:hypothetical protein
MSLWQSLRAGHIAGKAAILYRDVRGEPPRAHDAEYLKEMAHYISDEYVLAFDVLLRALSWEFINENGELITEYAKLNSPVTQRTLQSLMWMAQTKKIDSNKIETLDKIISEIKKRG